jgi:hypothetical protein
MTFEPRVIAGKDVDAREAAKRGRRRPLVKIRNFARKNPGTFKSQKTVMAALSRAYDG